MYCNSNIGALLTCSVKGCRQAFHATCGFAAGANFERRDWPTLFSAVCTDHNAPSGVRHHSLIDNPKVSISFLSTDSHINKVIEFFCRLEKKFSLSGMTTSFWLQSNG